MTSPQVSIIIPVYNEENYLPGCLHHIRMQSLPPAEVIVVDNNSTDNSANIAREFGARVIAEPRQGMSFARNAGFQAAKFEILARIDADTLLPPTWVQKVQEQFVDPIIGITGPVKYVGFGDKTTSLLQVFYELLYFKTSRRWLGYEVFHGPNMALRRDVWQAMQATLCNRDDLYHEDTDLSIHAHPYGEIQFDPDLIVLTSPRRIYKPHTLFDYAVRHAKGMRHGKTRPKTRALS